ncbi:PleD family two-component system response regulator [Nocardioides sp.]|uniref:response regulator n=1 Tax=Nocardioides sp. TaxID=35761 RepID=UPI00271FDBFA|nr:response regulator transcription factor [Nocardioides sp.]MDO9454683.1 response regulator transcription factor [Nocardioides sp.]
MPTILVADDDSDIAHLARRALVAAGHDVVVAADGATALVHVGSVDLAVLDVSMPRLNGWEATEVIRATSETRDLPVIVVSGLTSADQITTALDAGADGYLTKPFVPFELVRRVEHLLDTSPVERRTTRRAGVRRRDLRSA